MARLTKEQLRAKWSKIGPAAQKTLANSVKNNAKELAAAIRAAAPFDDGDLSASVNFEIKTESNGYASAVVKAGGKGVAPYVGYVEYGTSDTAAQPFFWPVYRALKKRLVARSKRAVRRAIKQGTIQ